MNADFTTQYNHVRMRGAGVLEFPKRGLLEISGAEAIPFLNGLITNDVKTLADQTWMLAAFPNVQGRLLAFARILRLEDKFLFDVEAENYQKILANLQRFTFAGDFKLRDLSDEMRLLEVSGADSFEIVNHNFQVPNALEKIAQTEFQNQTVFTIRASHTGAKGFDLFVPTAIYEAVKAEFAAQNAIEIGDEAGEVLRVEAGLPKYGVDVDESNVVLESGLDAAVSFNKGCYIGQEIIARIHFRGHVAKKIAGLILPENAEIAVGDALQSVEGKAAGRITSTVFSPILNQRIALGIVRYDFLSPNTELLILHGEHKIKVQTVELPFVK